MVVGRSVEFAFIAYGFLFAISLVVAVIIKIVYWVVHRGRKAEPIEDKGADKGA